MSVQRYTIAADLVIYSDDAAGRWIEVEDHEAAVAAAVEQARADERQCYTVGQESLAFDMGRAAGLREAAAVVELEPLLDWAEAQGHRVVYRADAVAGIVALLPEQERA